jgi:c-di-GMP-binding flagellar brake protein YcgR
MINKRRYERVAWFCPVQLRVLPDGPDIPANSFDISIGGVGVATNIMLERGQTVRVRFHLHCGTNGSAEMVDEDVLGRVAYSRADEDGDRIGIEFMETINGSAQPTLANKLNSL